MTYTCTLLGLDDSRVDEFLVTAADHMTAARDAARHPTVAHGLLGLEISYEGRRLVYLPHPKRCARR